MFNEHCVSFLGYSSTVDLFVLKVRSGSMLLSQVDGCEDGVSNLPKTTASNVTQIVACWTFLASIQQQIV